MKLRLRVMLLLTLTVLILGVAGTTGPVATELGKGLPASPGLTSGDPHTALEGDATVPFTPDCGTPNHTNDGWSAVTPPIYDDGPPCGWATCGPCVRGQSRCCDNCGCFMTWCT